MKAGRIYIFLFWVNKRSGTKINGKNSSDIFSGTVSILYKVCGYSLQLKNLQKYLNSSYLSYL